MNVQNTVKGLPRMRDKMPQIRDVPYYTGRLETLYCRRRYQTVHSLNFKWRFNFYIDRYKLALDYQLDCSN